MVKNKVSQIKNKRITPYKLKGTNGPALKRKTGNIYLVADVLGKKEVKTPKNHYAAINEEKGGSAANVEKLREP